MKIRCHVSANELSRLSQRAIYVVDGVFFPSFYIKNKLRKKAMQ